MKKNESSLEPAVARRGAAIAAELAPQLAAAEPESDLEGRFAASNVEAIRDAGLLGLNVPASSGGLGESLSGTLDTLRIIAQGSPSTALMLSMHTSVLANLLIDSGAVPSDQRNSFLERRAWAFAEAVGGRIFAVANSEAGAGGDVHNSRASVTNGFLTGEKTFCSMGTNADYFMAAARDESGKVEYHLVRNEPGSVHTSTPWQALGMRSSESVSLSFNNAPVEGPLTYRGMLDGVNNRHWATLSFTAISIGIAESLLADIVSPRATMLQRTTAVEMHLALQACRAFLASSVHSEPARITPDYLATVRDCKTFVTRTLADQATRAFTTQGGSAYHFSSAVSRKMRDLLAGPFLRPPVAVAFDAIWNEMASRGSSI